MTASCIVYIACNVVLYYDISSYITLRYIALYYVIVLKIIVIYTFIYVALYSYLSKLYCII